MGWSDKDQAMRDARKANVGTMSRKLHKRVDTNMAKYVFEYNTVEGLLLSCSVVVCLFGIMLDSDYLEDGKHPTVREGLSYVTLAIIGSSLAYFGAVIWHEIVIELFPFLKCACLEPAPQRSRKSSFDATNLEMAEGNFARRADKPQKGSDANLMTVQEQLDMKKLLSKQQDELRQLKKDLAAASKVDAKTTAKIVKKKKGFGMFSPSKAEERGSVSVDMADAYDTSKTIGGTNPLRKKP